jgi:beta-galactosidase
MSNVFPLSSMAYGGDYNPEQWPESVWHEDVRLMQEAGVNLVSLGIFSWAKLEPQPGQYDFEWLDRIIDLLYQHGVHVDLATATASPPPWMAKLHPESLPITKEGVWLWHGSRQHYCPNSTAYRTSAQALVRRLAERYRDHPALAMWHVGNEYACHVSECFCDESAQAFREWLKQRYGTLEKLNAAWGTAFWSQQYGDWDEIVPPRTTPTFINPTQQLDWRRFSSDALLECFELEHAILKEVTPHVPVTTNFMRVFKPLDYWKWAAHEDLVTLDCYPDLTDPEAHVDAALNFDLTRSLGHGKPWLLMEQATSQVNWRPQNPIKGPGLMRLWSHQAVARGSDGVMFFQWRAAKAGAEKFHSGMVPHGGTNTRTWREVVELGQELRRMGAVRDTRVVADVAIMFDWESWWAVEGEGRVSQDVRYIDQIRACYDRFYERNITVDFVAPGADLSAYRLVVLPCQHLISNEHAAQIEQYVANGGTLLTLFFSGIVDENDHIHLGGYPAPFRKVLGLRVEEFSPMAPGQTNLVVCDDENDFSGDLWFDVIELQGASAIARFANDFYSGLPAATRHSFGQGLAFYLGTRLNVEGMRWLIGRVCAEAGVTPVLEAPAGVEALRRVSDGRTLLYVLNHNNTPQKISVPSGAKELLSAQSSQGSFELAPRGVAIFQLDGA